MEPRVDPALRRSFALAQSPPQQSDLRQSALAFEQQGKFTDSEQAWREYLKTDPSDADPYAHLGLLEARQEHYKAAIPLYRKALALKPGAMGRKEEAKAELDKASSITRLADQELYKKMSGAGTKPPG